MSNTVYASGSGKSVVKVIQVEGVASSELHKPANPTFDRFTRRFTFTRRVAAYTRLWR